MRWLHSVGLVLWRRFSPDLKEILSGGVGLVRWCRNGLWDETWDFRRQSCSVEVLGEGPASTIYDWRIRTGRSERSRLSWSGDTILQPGHGFAPVSICVVCAAFRQFKKSEGAFRG